ncbi:MAG: release factor glutamine methyltransferase [Luteibaculaceae bacterium]|jgi:release factor glutamine methyltransferase
MNSISKETIFSLFIPAFSEREKEIFLQWLLEDLFDGKRIQSLSKREGDLLLLSIERINKGEPIQHVTGKAHFYDLILKSDKRGLIPRPETEELVHAALEKAKPSAAIHVLDICTGSGCIPLAIKANRPFWTVEGWDISELALDLAKENCQEQKLEVGWKTVDILSENLPKKNTWDIIVSNPPYIPLADKKDMSPTVVDFDPALALFVEDQDALVFYDRIAKFAFQNLKEAGYLGFEIHHQKGIEIVQILENLGFKEVSLIQDLNNNDRFVWGVKKPLLSD